jgi:hypothetical protein
LAGIKQVEHSNDYSHGKEKDVWVCPCCFSFYEEGGGREREEGKREKKTLTTKCFNPL